MSECVLGMCKQIHFEGHVLSYKIPIKNQSFQQFILILGGNIEKKSSSIHVNYDFLPFLSLVYF